MNPLNILWAIAFGVCPQRPSHSLFFDGQQMPIEARMAGIFAGFLIGAGYMIALGRGRAWLFPGHRMTILLIGFVILLGADGINATLYDLRLPHLYTPNLPMRLGTGLVTGLAVSAFLIPAFNATVWRTGKNLSPFSNARDLLGGITLLVIYFVAAFTGSGILLYPLSLLGVLGVPVILTLTNATILAAVFRRSNQANRLAELAPLLALGFMTTIGILILMSGVRYTLFGIGPLEMPVFTWKGA